MPDPNDVTRATVARFEAAEFLPVAELSDAELEAAWIAPLVLRRPANMYEKVADEGPSILWEHCFNDSQRQWVQERVTGSFIVMALNSGDGVPSSLERAKKLSEQEKLPVVFTHSGYATPFLVDLSKHK